MCTNHNQWKVQLRNALDVIKSVRSFLLSHPSLPYFLSGMNYCGLARAGITGIMQMAELGELDAYLATQDVFQLSEYKDNPGAIKNTL
jgi:hypothetical protein